MKLKQLSLANFRGFKQLDIDLELDLTVIAGVNGAGKSAVLRAATAAISHVLPKLTPSLEDSLDLSPEDIHRGAAALAVSAVLWVHGAEVRADIARSMPFDRDRMDKLITRRDELRFALRGTAKGSEEQRDIEEDLRVIENQISGGGDVSTVRIFPAREEESQEELIQRAKAEEHQPLAIFYSTARFLSRLPPVMPKAKRVEVATAFRSALTQTEVSLNDFGNWIRVLDEGAIRRPDLRETIRAQLEAAVQALLPGFSGLELHDGRPPRFSLKKEGNRLFLEQLSDGERGLLALVFDLTRRLCIANPESANPIVEGAALVLIDEIELHLHPKWQRQVIRRLREVFKNCQWIITTHSPQVIGQVPSEKLRLFYFDESNRVAVMRPTQSFGMDSSWILQHIMGAPARDYETEQRLMAIYNAIDSTEYTEARRLAEELRAELGDFPDLQEAIALLDRLALLGDDEED